VSCLRIGELASTVTRTREQLAAEIERYCSRHPDARDTIDGIAWWLVQQRFEDARAEVQEAADYLVERGILERRPLADGTVLFCCRSAGHREQEH
jgi:hypothetical protein